MTTIRSALSLALTSQSICVGLLIAAIGVSMHLHLLADILWTDILHTNPHRSLAHALSLAFIMGPLLVILSGIFIILILAIPQLAQALLFALALKILKREHLGWALAATPMLAGITLYFLDLSSPIWSFNFSFNQTGDETPYLLGFHTLKYMKILCFQGAWSLFCLLYLTAELDKKPKQRMHLIIGFMVLVPAFLITIRTFMR